VFGHHIACGGHEPQGLPSDFSGLSSDFTGSAL
jgi:hypothetical protein